MNIRDICIRDPYILAHEGVYYMYGRVMPDKTSFYVYKSRDLFEWSVPQRVFERPDTFWADRDFWAPEVHYYKGKFYMLASFNAETRHRATQILCADAPDGSFLPLANEPVTPDEWECLDGTLYTDKSGRPYIVFCHEWTQTGDGEICAAELSADLKKRVGEPRLLWKASDFAGSVNISDGVSKVTDGPFLYKTQSGELLCIWSTFTKNGYSELISKSESGDIDGKWSVCQNALSEKHGGHGMIFTSFEGDKLFVMHCPNNSPYERAVIYRLYEDNGSIRLSDEPLKCAAE